MYLLDIQVHYGPTLWAAADGEATTADLDLWEEDAQGDPSVVWHTGEEPDGYRETIAAMERITLTIAYHKGPTRLWIELQPSAVRQFRYPVRCKYHECPGPTCFKPLDIHLHRSGSIRQEVQNAMAPLSQELFLSESDVIYESVIRSLVLNWYEANMSRLDWNHIQPVTTPGLHFHGVLYLAAVRGIIIGTGTRPLAPMERVRARGVEPPPPPPDDEGSSDIPPPPNFWGISAHKRGSHREQGKAGGPREHFPGKTQPKRRKQHNPPHRKTDDTHGQGAGGGGGGGGGTPPPPTQAPLEA